MPYSIRGMVCIEVTIAAAFVGTNTAFIKYLQGLHSLLITLHDTKTSCFNIDRINMSYDHLMKISIWHIESAGLLVSFPNGNIRKIIRLAISFRFNQSYTIPWKQAGSFISSSLIFWITQNVPDNFFHTTPSCVGVTHECKVSHVLNVF